MKVTQGYNRLTHGLSRNGKYGNPTRVYSCWCNMKARVLRPTHPKYKFYGGKGVTINPRWMLFENFYKDMGDMPIGMSLDRIDSTKGYSKENCQWIATKENCCKGLMKRWQ